MSETKKPKISLKKLAEFNTVWHEESALVFKSNKELVVIGKLVNKEIVTLTEDDISICEKFRFKYEIITKEEEEEEEEDGQEDRAPPAEEEDGSNVTEGTEEEPEPEASAEEEEEVEEEAAAVNTEEVKVEPTPIFPKSIITKPIEQPVVAVTTSSDFMTTVYNLQTIWETTTHKNINKIHCLEIELDKKTKEFMDLQDLYDKMKIKFDGIKQLFS